MIFKAAFPVLFSLFLLPGIHAEKKKKTCCCEELVESCGYMGQNMRSCTDVCPSDEKEHCCGDGLVMVSNARCHAPKNVDLKTDSSISRQLGDVVHYEVVSATTGIVPRSEVVASVEDALNGGADFEVQYYVHDETNKKTLEMRDLTKNDMRLSRESDDLSGAFAVANAFVKDEPDVFYKVECPAAELLQKEHTHKKHKHKHKHRNTSDCGVTAFDNEGNALVNCFEDESNLTMDNIPPTCLDEIYDLNLMSLQGQIHFFLNAVRKDTNAGYQDDCPTNVGIDSFDGIKKKAVVFKNDLRKLPQHMLGSASLGSILEAEEDAEPLNLATEDCAHYAQRIWRSLDISETNELAQFIISNVVEKGEIDDLKKIRNKYGKGGVRALAAYSFGGKEALLGFIHNVVFSELDIPEF